MNRLRLLLLFLVSFGPLASAHGQDDLPSTVREQVMALNADRLADRNAAERALMEMGHEIVPLLPAATDAMPAEMRQRLARIRAALEEQAARAATEGSRVTLAGTMKLSEAIASLSEQSGNQVVDFRAALGQETPDVELELDLKDAPFWKALDSVLSEAGLVVMPHAEPDGPGIAVAAPRLEQPERQWVAYDGPFRMEATRISAVRDLSREDAGRLQVTIQVRHEPGLKPITMSLPMDSVSAIATLHGKVNPIQTAIGGVRPITVIGTETNVDLPLSLPGREATDLRRLSGHFRALLPGKVEQFRFENLPPEQPVEQRRAGAVVTLDRVRKNNDVWEFRIRVRFDDPSDALESYLMGWVLDNAAYLENAEGERIDFGALEKTGEGNDEFGVAYLFFPDGEIGDYTFVYETPAALIAREVAFEFRNIPLP